MATLHLRLPFAAFDADNHYYEATDAFTRHLDPRMGPRAVQWATVNGKPRLLTGNRVCRFLPHPAFEIVAKPGVMEGYFRGKEGVSDIRSAMGELEPCRDEYRDRDARLAVMDGQGLEAAWFFPTLGVGIEEALRDDPEACHAAFHAFNRWLLDDWGFAYKERIFGVPYITFGVPERAVQELEWCLQQGARAFVMRAAPVTLTTGQTITPANEMFDDFWSLANDSGITCTVHSGDSGYGRHVSEWEPQGEFEAFRHRPFGSIVTAERPMIDLMASFLAHGLFRRFPNLRVATIETGSAWVGELFRRLKKSYGQLPQAYGENPIDVFRRHVWVSPHFEDDIAALAELIGEDRVLFGSDYPHVEGLATPTDYVHDLDGLGDDAVRKIMRDNLAGLIERRAVAP